MKKVVNYVRRKRLKFDSSENSICNATYENLLSLYAGSENVLNNDTISIYDVGSANTGWTKLHIAAWVGDVPKIKSKLKKVPIDTRDGIGRTALHLATSQGHAHAVAFLIAHKADVTVQDNDGKTALHKATEFGHRECVQMLLDQGTAGLVNVPDSLGDTPLHIATRIGSYDLSSMLLQKGADLEISNIEGQFPLHMACFFDTKCNYDLVELLLRYGAFINVRDKRDISPLMLASSRGLVDVVQLFLEYVADKTIKDAQGKTAYFYAIENNFSEIAKLLDPQIESDLLETSLNRPCIEEGSGSIIEVKEKCNELREEYLEDISEKEMKVESLKVEEQTVQDILLKSTSLSPHQLKFSTSLHYVRKEVLNDGRGDCGYHDQSIVKDNKEYEKLSSNKNESGDADMSESDWEDDFSFPIKKSPRLSPKKSPFHPSNARASLADQIFSQIKKENELQLQCLSLSNEAEQFNGDPDHVVLEEIKCVTFHSNAPINDTKNDVLSRNTHEEKLIINERNENVEDGKTVSSIENQSLAGNSIESNTKCDDEQDEKGMIVNNATKDEVPSNSLHGKETMISDQENGSDISLLSLLFSSLENDKCVSDKENENSIESSIEKNVARDIEQNERSKPANNDVEDESSVNDLHGEGIISDTNEGEECCDINEIDNINLRSLLLLSSEDDEDLGDMQNKDVEESLAVSSIKGDIERDEKDTVTNNNRSITIMNTMQNTSNNTPVFNWSPGKMNVNILKRYNSFPPHQYQTFISDTLNAREIMSNEQRDKRFLIRILSEFYDNLLCPKLAYYTTMNLNEKMMRSKFEVMLRLDLRTKFNEKAITKCGNIVSGGTSPYKISDQISDNIVTFFSNRGIRRQTLSTGEKEGALEDDMKDCETRENSDMDSSKPPHCTISTTHFDILKAFGNLFKQDKTSNELSLDDKSVMDENCSGAKFNLNVVGSLEEDGNNKPVDGTHNFEKIDIKSSTSTQKGSIIYDTRIAVVQRFSLEPTDANEEEKASQLENEICTEDRNISEYSNGNLENNAVESHNRSIIFNRHNYSPHSSSNCDSFKIFLSPNISIIKNHYETAKSEYERTSEVSNSSSNESLSLNGEVEPCENASQSAEPSVVACGKEISEFSSKERDKVDFDAQSNIRSSTLNFLRGFCRGPKQEQTSVEALLDINDCSAVVSESNSRNLLDHTLAIHSSLNNEPMDLVMEISRDPSYPGVVAPSCRCGSSRCQTYEQDQSLSLDIFQNLSIMSKTNDYGSSRTLSRIRRTSRDSVETNDHFGVADRTTGRNTSVLSNFNVLSDLRLSDAESIIRVIQQIEPSRSHDDEVPGALQERKVHPQISETNIGTSREKCSWQELDEEENVLPRPLESSCTTMSERSSLFLPETSEFNRTAETAKVQVEEEEECELDTSNEFDCNDHSTKSSGQNDLELTSTGSSNSLKIIQTTKDFFRKSDSDSKLLVTSASTLRSTDYDEEFNKADESIKKIEEQSRSMTNSENISRISEGPSTYSKSSCSSLRGRLQRSAAETRHIGKSFTMLYYNNAARRFSSQDSISTDNDDEVNEEFSDGKASPPIFVKEDDEIQKPVASPTSLGTLLESNLSELKARNTECNIYHEEMFNERPEEIKLSRDSVFTNGTSKSLEAFEEDGVVEAKRKEKERLLGPYVSCGSSFKSLRGSVSLPDFQRELVGSGNNDECESDIWSMEARPSERSSRQRFTEKMRLLANLGSHEGKKANEVGLSSQILEDFEQNYKSLIIDKCAVSLEAMNVASDFLRDESKLQLKTEVVKTENKFGFITRGIIDGKRLQSPIVSLYKKKAQDAVVLLRDEYDTLKATLRKNNDILQVLIEKFHGYDSNLGSMAKEKGVRISELFVNEKESLLRVLQAEVEILRQRLATSRQTENTKTLETLANLQQKNCELQATINGLNQTLVDHRIKVTELKEENRKHQSEKDTMKTELNAHIAEVNYLARRSLPNDPAVVRKISKLEERIKEFAKTRDDLLKILKEEKIQHRKQLQMVFKGFLSANRVTIAQEFSRKEAAPEISVCKDSDTIGIKEFCKEMSFDNPAPVIRSSKINRRRSDPSFDRSTRGNKIESSKLPTVCLVVPPALEVPKNNQKGQELAEDPLEFPSNLKVYNKMIRTKNNSDRSDFLPNRRRPNFRNLDTLRNFESGEVDDAGSSTIDVDHHREIPISDNELKKELTQGIAKDSSTQVSAKLETKVAAVQTDVSTPERLKKPVALQTDASIQSMSIIEDKQHLKMNTKILVDIEPSTVIAEKRKLIETNVESLESSSHGDIKDVKMHEIFSGPSLTDDTWATRVSGSIETGQSSVPSVEIRESNSGNDSVEASPSDVDRNVDIDFERNAKPNESVTSSDPSPSQDREVAKCCEDLVEAVSLYLSSSEEKNNVLEEKKIINDTRELKSESKIASKESPCVDTIRELLHMVENIFTGETSVEETNLCTEKSETLMQFLKDSENHVGEFIREVTDLSSRDSQLPSTPQSSDSRNENSEDLEVDLEEPKLSKIRQSSQGNSITTLHHGDIVVDEILKTIPDPLETDTSIKTSENELADLSCGDRQFGVENIDPSYVTATGMSCPVLSCGRQENYEVELSSKFEGDRLKESMILLDVEDSSSDFQASEQSSAERYVHSKISESELTNFKTVEPYEFKAKKSSFFDGTKDDERVKGELEFSDWEKDSKLVVLNDRVIDVFSANVAFKGQQQENKIGGRLFGMAATNEDFFESDLFSRKGRESLLNDPGERKIRESRLLSICIGIDSQEQIVNRHEKSTVSVAVGNEKDDLTINESFNKKTKFLVNACTETNIPHQSLDVGVITESLHTNVVSTEVNTESIDEETTMTNSRKIAVVRRTISPPTVQRSMTPDRKSSPARSNVSSTSQKESNDKAATLRKKSKGKSEQHSEIVARKTPSKKSTENTVIKIAKPLENVRTVSHSNSVRPGSAAIESTGSQDKSALILLPRKSNLCRSKKNRTNTPSVRFNPKVKWFSREAMDKKRSSVKCTEFIQRAQSLTRSGEGAAKVVKKQKSSTEAIDAQPKTKFSTSQTDVNEESTPDMSKIHRIDVKNCSIHGTGYAMTSFSSSNPDCPVILIGGGPVASIGSGGLPVLCPVHSLQNEITEAPSMGNLQKYHLATRDNLFKSNLKRDTSKNEEEEGRQWATQNAWHRLCDELSRIKERILEEESSMEEERRRFWRDTDNVARNLPGGEDAESLRTLRNEVDELIGCLGMRKDSKILAPRNLLRCASDMHRVCDIIEKHGTPRSSDSSNSRWTDDRPKAETESIIKTIDRVARMFDDIAMPVRYDFITDDKENCVYEGPLKAGNGEGVALSSKESQQSLSSNFKTTSEKVASNTIEKKREEAAHIPLTLQEEKIQGCESNSTLRRSDLLNYESPRLPSDVDERLKRLDNAMARARYLLPDASPAFFDDDETGKKASRSTETRDITEVLLKARQKSIKRSSFSSASRDFTTTFPVCRSRDNFADERGGSWRSRKLCLVPNEEPLMRNIRSIVAQKSSVSTFGGFQPVKRSRSMENHASEIRRSAEMPTFPLPYREREGLSTKMTALNDPLEFSTENSDRNVFKKMLRVNLKRSNDSRGKFNDRNMIKACGRSKYERCSFSPNRVPSLEASKKVCNSPAL